MARSLTSGGINSSKRRKPREANEAICREFSKYFLSTIYILQLFKNKFVFVKRRAEFRTGIWRDQLRKLNHAPACPQRVHPRLIRRCIAVARRMVFAPGSVVDRPADHVAIQR